MAANVAPIYPKSPNLGFVSLGSGITALTNSTGAGTIGTNLFLVEAAGVDGTIFRRIKFIPTATAPTVTTATVARVFLSTVSSGATTTADTHLIAELVLAAQNADNATGAVVPVEMALDLPVPTGMNILVGLHAVPPATVVWKCVLMSSDY